MIKHAIKIAFPSIKYNKKIYIPRCFQPINKELIEVKYFEVFYKIIFRKK